MATMNELRIHYADQLTKAIELALIEGKHNIPVSTKAAQELLMIVAETDYACINRILKNSHAWRGCYDTQTCHTGSMLTLHECGDEVTIFFGEGGGICG